MEPALMHMITKFPDNVGKIIDMYQVDEDFRELCSDFLVSTEALTECKVKAVKNQEYETHYKQICVELEKEIISFLKSPE